MPFYDHNCVFSTLYKKYKCFLKFHSLGIYCICTLYRYCTLVNHPIDRKNAEYLMWITIIMALVQCWNVCVCVCVFCSYEYQCSSAIKILFMHAYTDKQNIDDKINDYCAIFVCGNLLLQFITWCISFTFIRFFYEVIM